MKNKIKISIVLSLCICLLGTKHSYAQEIKYVGVFRSGDGGNIVTEPLNWAAFKTKGADLVKTGLRLVDVETYKEGSTRKYIGVFREGTGGNIVTEPLSWTAFKTRGEELVKTGLRLMAVESFKDGNTRKYVGVYREGTGGNIVTEPLSSAAFKTKGEELVKTGLRLIDVETFKDGSTWKYIGVFREGKGGNIVTEPLQGSKFNQRFNELLDTGLFLVDLEMLEEGKTMKFVGVFREGKNDTGTEPSSTVTGPLTRQELKLKKREYAERGFFIKKIIPHPEPTGDTKFVAVFGTDTSRVMVTLPLGWSDFKKKGAELTKKGLRLVDLETFFLPMHPQPGTTPPLPGSNPSPLPEYITLGLYLTIDFTALIEVDGRFFPKITLPEYALPLLPIMSENGDIVFPDNICGIRLTSPEIGEYYWMDAAGKVIPNSDYSPYISTVGMGRNDHQEIARYFSNGVDITGPIGACKNGQNPFHLSFPLTKAGHLAPNNAKVKLYFDRVWSVGEIEFLNHNHEFIPDKPENIFKEPTFRDILKEILEGDITTDFCRAIKSYCSLHPKECSCHY